MAKIKKTRELLLCVLVCTAGICFFGAGIHFWGQAHLLHQNVSLFLQEEKMTVPRADAIREIAGENEDFTEFTAWTIAGSAYIYDEGEFRRVETEVIELNGSSELLLFSGSVLHEDDKDGCLLGWETAKELFGNTNVCGQTVCYGKRRLTVRGILWNAEEIMLVQAGEGTFFERITLQGSPGITKSMQAERFCMNYGIQGELLRTEVFSPEFLAELVPAKWSDFEGWKNNTTVFLQGWSLFSCCAKSKIEQRYLADQNRGMFLIGAGLAMGVIFLILLAGRFSLSSLRIKVRNIWR